MQLIDGGHATRLRLCAGLAFIAVDGGAWLVEGATRRHRFTGTSAATMVDVLIPALRTWRTLRELVDVTGLSEAIVTAMVAHLGRSGLIEESTASLQDLAPDDEMDDEARMFLSRALEEIDGYHSVDEIAWQLAQYTVVHLGDSPAAEAICADLRRVGVGRVLRADHESDIDLVLPPTLVLLPWTAAFPADLPQGTEILRYGLAADRVEIGPLFGRVGSVCFPCFEASHRACFDDEGDPLPGEELLAGLVVTEALAVCAAVTEPQDINTLGVIDLGSLKKNTYTLIPEPGCPRCGDQAPAEQYEDQVAANFAGLSVARNDSHRAVQRLAADVAKRPSFPTSPRWILGAREDVPALHGAITRRWAETEPGIAVPADSDALAGILLKVGGRRRQTEMTRFAASAGNMGSVELYAVADDEAFGFPAGTLLKYDDLDHAVLVPRTGAVPAGELCGLDPVGRVAVLFFVGAVKRLAPKYLRFSYRLALLDAGCALAQLSAVCHGYGLRAVQAPRIDGAASGELDLLDGEIVTAAVGIYRKDSPCR